MRGGGAGGGMGRASGRDFLSEEDEIRRGYDRRLLGQFARFLKPFRGLIVLAVVVSLVAAGLELLGPLIIKVILDGPVAKGLLDEIPGWILLYAGLIVATFALEALMIWIVNWTGQSVMLEMRQAIFSHLQRLDVRYYDKNPVGRLLTRVMNDVAALNELLAMGIPTIFRDLLILFGIIVILFYLDWKLALTVFVCFPLIIVACLRFSRVVRVYYRQTRARLAAMNTFLQENISGMRVVQLFGREPRSRDRFAELNGVYRDAQLGTVVAFSLLFPVIELASALALALILWHGGARMIDNTITFGVLTAFVLYARRFFLPIRELAEKFNVFESALAAAERIFALLDTEPEIVDPPQPVPGKPFDGRIEFDRVWFAYDDREWVLKDLSFTVERGQTVAIVGATGAGKTTVINLLQRFYDLDRGAIRLDGADLREMAQRDLRRKMAVVLQDVFLFHGSIAENIRLGRPNLSDEEVRRAALTVNADPFIQRLEGGYDYEVLERGATLSVGQKQLLAFARALACSPEILILDEATSNIDTETERLIQDALFRLLEGRTAIIIAHRLSTIKRADKILVFHHGRLREQGTHDELLALRGLYWRLSRLQLNGDSYRLLA
jgi:ATP-binding cassette subfamily B multidrug efflux pump